MKKTDIYNHTEIDIYAKKILDTLVDVKNEMD